MAIKKFDLFQWVMTVIGGLLVSGTVALLYRVDKLSSSMATVIEQVQNQKEKNKEQDQQIVQLRNDFFMKPEPIKFKEYEKPSKEN